LHDVLLLSFVAIALAAELLDRFVLGDEPACHLKGSDLDHIEASATSPRLDFEESDCAAFIGVLDQTGMATHQHAPSRAHGLVNLVDLESDNAGDVTSHCIGGPKDDRSIREDEVHREGNGTRSGGQNDPSDAACTQVLLALI
jgi:hypothetical protein